MKKISSVFATILLFVPVVAAIAAPGDTLYTHPGQIVSAGDGALLNFYCMGHGSPAVVFDSGWEDWAPAWAVVQPRVARFTRACSYDRAGAGFSLPGPLPRTNVRIADELHAALHAARVSGPYILIGHAFGSDNVRAFADRYMDEVAGLVMVEADASDLEPRAMQKVDDEGDAKFVQRVRECGNAIASRKPLPSLPARPGQPHRTCAQQFFRGIPDTAWSPELNSSLLKLAESKASMYDAYASEMEQMPWDEEWLKAHVRSLGARPLRILTTGNHAVGHLPPRPDTNPKHLEYEHQIALAQARWLPLSSNAKQIFVTKSSEYIPFDQPDAVVGAIREVYDQSK